MILPPLGQYVLIHVPSRPWTDDSDQAGVFWRVAKRVACDHGAGAECGACSVNNRRAGYDYRELGPGSFYADEVERWEELPR